MSQGFAKLTNTPVEYKVGVGCPDPSNTMLNACGGASGGLDMQISSSYASLEAGIKEDTFVSEALKAVHGTGEVKLEWNKS